MPYYPGLMYNKNLIDERVFIKDKIVILKDAFISKNVPKKTVDDTLLIATWNIREFDSTKYGERLESAYYYIAEIISHFDFVAIQEVREDLKALKKLMSILGNTWSYIVSDITEGKAGNGERMAFVYDNRKVRFNSMAGELVLPIQKNKETMQFARTPYIVSFQSGWFKFNITTVLAYYGKGKPGLKRRNEEIKAVAMFLKKRIGNEAKYTLSQWDDYSYILLGDFNIINRTDETFISLTKGTNFYIHEAIMKKELAGTNVNKDKYYDQIAFSKNKGLLEMGTNAGIFDFFEYVFTDKEFKYYKGFIKKTGVTEKTYKDWRTYQMSDHLPLWVELKIDFSRKYLDGVK